MRYAFHVFAPYRVGAQGRDLRLGAHAAATTRSTSRPRALAAAHGRARLDGHHRRRARDHGGGHRGRGRRQRVRREHPAAVRGRRRAQFLADDPKLINFRYFFTRKLDVREGVRRVRAAPRRLRHARRGVRAAHARADRQGAAGADRCCSTSPAAPTGSTGASSSSAELERPGYISPEDDRPRSASPTTCETAVDEVTGFYAQLPLAAVRRRADLVLRLQHAPSADAARRAQRRVRRHRRARRDRDDRGRRPTRSPTTTTSTSPASRSASTATAGRACAC